MTEGRVDVVAEPIQQGRTQQLWQVLLTRADGKLVARGQVRLQNVKLPGEGGDFRVYADPVGHPFCLVWDV